VPVERAQWRGRIAVIASAEDYLQDVVFHGLAMLLGSENVVDYPRVERYHTSRPETVTAAQHWAQLWLDLPEPPRPPLDKLVASSDAVVIGSLHDDGRPVVEEVLRMKTRPPVVFLDGDDSFFVRRIHSNVDVYCKREVVLPGTVTHTRETVRRLHRLARRSESRDPLTDPVAVARASNRRLIPLPFAWIGEPPPRGPIEFDVAFLGSLTTSRMLSRRLTHARGLLRDSHDHARAVLREGLERLAADGFRMRILEPGERLDRQSYLDILSRSRIGVSVRGTGFDTQRYWETPACGALLVAETPRIVIPDNFVSGEDAAFAPLEQLANRIRALLDTDTEPMAAAGRARLEAHHTSVSRAATVLAALATLA
jgi:hypothetical protein